jgi:glucokinase
MNVEISMLLAGDIGGTKTNLAVFSPEDGPRAPLAEATFPSADYPSLEALVREFLSQVDSKVERATFGVAGPVAAGRAAITNLPWVMEEGPLREALNFSSVRLLNDLAAIAHAVPFLEPADLHTLNVGQPAPGEAMAIIAPGTGLGEAFLTWDGSRYRPHASEGGHADFAPNNPFEVELLRYLQDRFEHVGYERVCSGRGLPNIYAYLKDSGYAEEPAWLTEQLAAADDPTPVIVNAALRQSFDPSTGLPSTSLRAGRASFAQGRVNSASPPSTPSSPSWGRRRGTWPSRCWLAAVSIWVAVSRRASCLPLKGFSAQRAHVGLSGACADARHPQPQGRAPGCGVSWIGVGA